MYTICYISISIICQPMLTILFYNSIIEDGLSIFTLIVVNCLVVS